MASVETPGEFIERQTEEYREKMRRAADEYYDTDYFERLGGPEDVIRVEFPHFAWREQYIGTLPTTRQMDLIYRTGEPYHRDRDLLVALSKQIRDEVKHARIFSHLATQFGVDADVVDWTNENYDRLVDQTDAATDWEKPQFVASGFQCSTEIMAAFMISNMADYLEGEYPDIAASLRDIVSDEGDHVHTGRLTAQRFATPADFDQMEAIAEKKYRAALDVLENL